MSDFESNLTTALNIFTQSVREAADVEIARMKEKEELFAEKIKMAAVNKIKEEKLSEKENDLNTREAFIGKREAADKERKIQLDTKEKNIESEKTRLSNLIGSL